MAAPPPVVAPPASGALPWKAEPSPVPEPPPVERWYGWQTLIVDAAAIVTGVAIAASVRDDIADPPTPLGTVSFAWYGLGAVGAPAVHYAHRRLGTGATTFGLRATVPVLTSLFGVVASCGRGRKGGTCADDGAAAGALTGLVGVAALDAAVFGWERYSQEPSTRTWYGWQTLIVDGAGLALGLGYAADEPKTKNGELLHPATATFVPLYTIGLFGGPIVHFVHGRVGIGFLSFGVRGLVAPMFALPGLVGQCTITWGAGKCAAEGAQWGILGGSLAVSLFDSLVLAWDKPSTESAAAPSWVPLVQPHADGVLVGTATTW
ncbi:MAG: hypothetical protein DIU78_001900 [Pseudomonadota bacterium]